MRLNNTAIENINRIYNEKGNCRFNKMLDLSIVDGSIGGTTIVNKNWSICELTELDNMIKSLTMMKEAIEEATGIIV